MCLFKIKVSLSTTYYFQITLKESAKYLKNYMFLSLFTILLSKQNELLSISSYISCFNPLQSSKVQSEAATS